MANVKALCRRVLHRLVGSPDLACQRTPELHGIVHGYQVKLEISMLAQTTQSRQYHYTNTTQATNIQVTKKKCLKRLGVKATRLFFVSAEVNVL